MLIKNARIVTNDEEFTGVMRVVDGRIAEVAIGETSAKNAEDWGGDYLMPGLVELSTDNIEKHFVPSVGNLSNFDAAMVAHDAEAASAGITTVFDAVRTGPHQGIDMRGSDHPSNWVRSVDRLTGRSLLRADHFLHLRCEIAIADVLEVFGNLASYPLLRLVSIIEPLPERGQWHDSHGNCTCEPLSTALETAPNEHHAQHHRSEIVARCKSHGLLLASHDVISSEQILKAAKDAVVLVEIPTILAAQAAQAAREHGISTIMSAQNIVLSGSNSEIMLALKMEKLGWFDILSSANYLPASLLAATFDLVHKAGWTLPQAMCTVSSTPAKAVGLTDRGAITVGLRADFVRVTLSDRLPVVRATFVQGKRVA